MHCKQEPDFVLTVKNITVEERNWILDSGSSKHLLNDLSLLEDSEEHATECVTLNNGSLRIT